MGRKPKSATVERPSTATDTVSPLETMENERHMEISGSTPSKKNATKDMNVFVRRSCRIKNTVSQSPNNEAVPEEVDLVDSYGQDTRVEEQLTNEPKEPLIGDLSTEPTSSQGDMDEKIDFLVQSVQEFKSMLRERDSPNGQKSALNYEELYIDSRKKIDSLIEENHELTKKLEFARGKAEAYEQMKDAFANFKETLHFSNLAKFAEAVFNISSQAGTTANCTLPVVGSPAHPPPRPPANNNNDNLRVVVSPTPAANVDEPKTSPQRNQRSRKKTKVSKLLS